MACAAAVAVVLLLSTGPPFGFNDGSNPGLGAAIVAVSPAVRGGGVPCPAQYAAFDPESATFSLAIFAALASAS